jgi:DNA-binding Xre family transcriptional regulator
MQTQTRNNTMLIEKKEKKLDINNYTVVELSKMIGISTVSLSRWATGKSQPSLDTIVKICQILDVKIDELVQIKSNK